MKITIWSDFVCPFCYIGVTNLEHALEKAGYDQNAFEIEYKSFQLEPDATYEEGKSYEFFDELYQAYFLHGELISDFAFLKEVSSKLGLDVERVDEILNTKEEYAKEVVLEIQQASQVGAQGVPFFVFDHKYGVSGAQPVEVFEEVLKKIENDFSKD